MERKAHKLIELIESASMYAKLESVQKLERKRRDLNETEGGSISYVEVPKGTRLE